MAKSLDARTSLTIASSGTLDEATTWIQNSGLINCAGKQGMNVEFQITFGAGATAEVYLYLVHSNDTSTSDPDKDITSAAEAYPLACVSAVASSTVVATPHIPLEYILEGNLIGFGAKNTDEATGHSVSITCYYQTLTL